jgi:pyridoxamine 5'-phosphate oxidase
MTDGERTAREDHAGEGLTSGNSGDAPNPFSLFGEWLAEATAVEPNDPNAMALATVDSDGLPDVRMVLLKAYDEAGFVFYTNLRSAKGRQLAAAPRAALLFHWKSLRRQVRVRGAVTPVSAAEADTYFRQRPRLSQIGAWSSCQSEPIASRAALEEVVALNTAKYLEMEDIPRPPHWSGLRVAADIIEFWRDGAFRLHDRLRYTRRGDGWLVEILQP